MKHFSQFSVLFRPILYIDDEYDISIEYTKLWNEHNSCACAASTVTKSDEKKRYFLEKLKETFLGLGRSIKRWICLINLHALFDRKNSIYGALLNPFLLTFSFIIPFFLITLNGQIQRHVSNAHAINEPTKSCRHCQVAYFSIDTKKAKGSQKLPKMSL